MKKIFLSVLAIAAMATTANAQLWFGGSVSFSHEGGVEKTKDKDIDSPSSSRFSFYPMAGFDLNEKLAIGGKLELSCGTSKDTRFGSEDNEIKTSSTSFGIVPFARYKFVEFNKFGLVAEAGLPIRTRSSKTTQGSNTTKGDPQNSIGIYVLPMLTYSLNDHFQLECGLDFLSLNATHSVLKDQDDKKHKTVRNSFNFGADTRTVATLGNITIGFIYKL